MIVIPARNEAPRIASVLAEIRAVLPDAPVVVVENGSTDDTAGIAHREGAILLRSAPGYARALREGFCYALARRAPWVVQMDADGQHPAAAIPRMIAALSAADVVIGSRFPGPVGYPMPLHRQAAVRTLGAWASLWAGQPLRDVTSGLRAWRPEALARMAPDFPTDIADANLLVRAVRRGLRLTEIPVPMRARRSGTSMHGGLDGARFALRMAVLTVREGRAAQEGR